MMNARIRLATAALLAAATLTACGGGGAAGPGLTPPAGNTGGSTQSVQAQTEDSIDTANDVGAPLKDISSYDDATTSPLQSAARRTQTASVQTAGDGTCANGVEFFAPDKNGDANSTERIVFYDNACTQMQSDTVRVYTSTGASSETVQRTASRYALNSSTPSAVKTEMVNYTNAAFDQFGYPIYKNGFDRTHAGELSVNGVKTIDADGELVVQPSSGSTATFCGDSAGFNATGLASLNETFGWAGVMPNGTRTVNQDGSVTWSLTHEGNTYTGAIGGLSITAGAQNAACPITTPMYALSGGTVRAQFQLPVEATFAGGVLTNLTIQNATLPNGDTLNMQTNAGVAPGNQHFISGTLAKNNTNIATFNVDAFGDGTLVVAASGTAYQIDDWHVVK